MKALILSLSLLVTSLGASASTDCADLKKELASMQEAQEKIMNSLVSNHETFASTMEEYSQVVSTSKSASSKSISQSMDQSAKAFRARGVQGKRMTGRLNQATGDLIARVSACLK